ncbi:hypothetical protein MKEN_01465800 [Mycena kentingensis (nom. inval.)]|nr:hypothetical protein MKEN_01465800 [Mycena kentingensis (nom. inval.)]
MRELWTSIPIDIYPKRAEREQAPNILHGDVRFLCSGAEGVGGDGAFQLIALFCRRAGSTGINLRITTGEPRARSADARAVVRVFSRLLESIGQWRSVALPFSLLKLLDEIGCAHRNTALPLLHHLQITDGMTAGIPTKPLSLFANAPNLRSLEISAIGPRNVKLQWQNLTRLVLRYYSIVPALELLVETGIAARLRYLQLQGISRYEQLNGRSFGLTLPALETLVLAHPSHPEFVGELTLPGLKTLDMHTISDRDGARGTAPAINALSRRSERRSELSTKSREDDFDPRDPDTLSTSAAPSASTFSGVTSLRLPLTPFHAIERMQIISAFPTLRELTLFAPSGTTQQSEYSTHGVPSMPTPDPWNAFLRTLALQCSPTLGSLLPNLRLLRLDDVPTAIDAHLLTALVSAAPLDIQIVYKGDLGAAEGEVGELLDAVKSGKLGLKVVNAPERWDFGVDARMVEKFY